MLFGTGWHYKPQGDEEKVGYVDDLDGDDQDDYVLIKEDDGDYAYVQKIDKYRKGGNKNFAVERRVINMWLIFYLILFIYSLALILFLIFIHKYEIYIKSLERGVINYGDSKKS